MNLSAVFPAFFWMGIFVGTSSFTSTFTLWQTLVWTSGLRYWAHWFRNYSYGRPVLRSDVFRAVSILAVTGPGSTTRSFVASLHPALQYTVSASILPLSVFSMVWCPRSFLAAPRHHLALPLVLWLLCSLMCLSKRQSTNSASVLLGLLLLPGLGSDLLPPGDHDDAEQLPAGYGDMEDTLEEGVYRSSLYIKIQLSWPFIFLVCCGQGLKVNETLPQLYSS